MAEREASLWMRRCPEIVDQDGATIDREAVPRPEWEQLATFCAYVEPVVYHDGESIPHSLRGRTDPHRRGGLVEVARGARGRPTFIRRMVELGVRVDMSSWLVRRDAAKSPKTGSPRTSGSSFGSRCAATSCTYAIRSRPSAGTAGR